MQISTGAGCTWTAESSTGYISVTDNARGAGGGLVQFTVLSNSSLARTASVSIVWPTGRQAIEVKQAGIPLRALIAGPSVCDISDPCDFDGAASTGPISGYLWDFGDGEQAFGSKVSHQYSESFVFGDGFEGERVAIVTLTVIGSDGKQHSATVMVTVVAGGALARQR